MTKKIMAAYHKPTPKKWKQIGLFILINQAVITASIPQWPISDNGKFWAVFAVNMICSALKFWTGTKTEKEATNEV